MQHGFARNRMFRVDPKQQSKSSVTLVLDDTKTDEFPFECELHITVSVEDDVLRQEAKVVNSGPEVVEFSFAFHTYFRLDHGIANGGIRGLKGTKYLDSLNQSAVCEEKDDIVTFNGEVDRIYLRTKDTLDVMDGDNVVRVEKCGLSDAVVWNPHVQKSASMSDFGDDEWKKMLCLEVAQAGSGMITVKPKEEWKGCQLITRIRNE